MTVAEMNEFLQGPWIAKIACLRPDGSPYIAPAGTTGMESRSGSWPGRGPSWAHFLVVDPRVSLVVDDPEPPMPKVLCEGTAVIVEAGVGPYLENGEMSVWNKIGTYQTGPRYLGSKVGDYRGEVTSSRAGPSRSSRGS